MTRDPGIEQVRLNYESRLDDKIRYSSLKPEILAQANERRTVLARLISKHLDVPLAEAQILDVGCGDGRDLNELLWLGASADRLAGNDLQDERLEGARARVPASVELLSGDIRQTRFEAGRFDLVTVSVVLMTIEDPSTRADVLRHIYSLVKPGGLLVITEPRIPNPRNKNVVRITEASLSEVLQIEPVYKKLLFLLPPLAPLARFPTLYGLAAAALPFLKFHRLYVYKKPMPRE